jgi:hypothetical protein
LRVQLGLLQLAVRQTAGRVEAMQLMAAAVAQKEKQLAAAAMVCQQQQQQLAKAVLLR